MLLIILIIKNIQSTIPCLSFQSNQFSSNWSGFQVNNEVLSALVLRHMRKDGTLRFGDFVSAVLHLTVAFGTIDYKVFFNVETILTLFLIIGTFDKRDPLQNGTVKLTLTEVNI